MSKEFQATSNSDKNNVLSEILCMRIEELFIELDVNLRKSGNRYVGACPIHGGKRISSFNIFPEGHTMGGYWKCRSHHCEEVFMPTILGFIRGVLSHKERQWEKEGQPVVAFKDVINWCCKFIGQNFDDIKVDKAEQERRRFAATVQSINNKPIKMDGVARSLVKEGLQIPADFFIKKGYSPEILIKYDVGLCNKQGKEMSSRIVVPVYDDSKNIMIGCTGRSIFPECNQCQSYHQIGSPCPSEEYRWLYSKWKHSKNFNTSSCLYNYWNAKKTIQENGVAILVEGPADVWRLEEAGIHNSLALFGCELTDEQQILLERSGAMSIIVLLDNDEAGEHGKKNIKAALKRSYNIYTPTYKGKDIGELNVGLIHADIVPTIQAVELKNKSYSF